MSLLHRDEFWTNKEIKAMNMRRVWREQRLKIILMGISLGVAGIFWQTQSEIVYQFLGGVNAVAHNFGRFFYNQPAHIEELNKAQFIELEAQVEELRSQNQELKQQLKFIKSRRPPGMAAQVIGRSASNWWQEITINRGEKDGVKLYDMVTSIGGLVGRITVIYPHTSRVQLITDPSLKIGVVVSRSRHTGYMRGKWPNRAVMEFFDNVPNVKVGDAVSTSSFSQLFPAGWTIGQVESVNMNKSPAPEATILLSAPMNQLEWVVIYPNNKGSDQSLPLTKPSPNPQPKN